MRRFVDGEEVDLDPGAASVTKLPDRLAVRGADGTYSAVALRSGDHVLVSYRGRVLTVENAKPRAKGGSGTSNGELRAPMPGQIVDVLVKAGDAVTKGQKVLVLEAMKTQQPFLAPFDGTVTSVPVEKGAQVADGALLASIEAKQL